jgi:hypothetical protein
MWETGAPACPTVRTDVEDRRPRLSEDPYDVKDRRGRLSSTNENAALAERRG